MSPMQNSEKEILVSDLELSVDYYSTILGIQGEGSKFVDEKKKFIIHLKQATDVTKIHPKKLQPELYVCVDTVEELYSMYLTYRNNGALFAFNPRDTYEEGIRFKEFAIRDLDGYVIAFKTTLSKENQAVH